MHQVTEFHLKHPKQFAFNAALISEKDNEIATILGHEVGHALARHVAEGLTKALWFIILRLLLYQIVLLPSVANGMIKYILRLPFSRKCDLSIIANGKKEKIASGLLNPFLAHLKTVQNQIEKGGYSILLEPDADEEATWFTKGTVERFVVKGGSPYGAGTIAGAGSLANKGPNDLELETAFHPGKYTAEIAKKLKGTA